MVFAFFFSPLPVLVTWLLPVAGTTYKLGVIKVFDLLWFPVEARAFPDWQPVCCCHCDQWVTMKREPQSDRAEIEHGDGSGMAETPAPAPASLWNVNMETHLFLFASTLYMYFLYRFNSVLYNKILLGALQRPEPRTRTQMPEPQ